MEKARFYKGLAGSALLLLQVAACSPKVIYQPAQVADSTRVEIRERIVYDTAFVEIERQVERVVTRDTCSILENTYAVSEAKISEGLLTHSLEAKAQRLPVPIVQVVRDTIVQAGRTETIYIPAPAQLSKWQSFSMVLGWLLGGVLAALILIRMIMSFIRRRA